MSPCSHIGGHKYAGNIIIYGPNADGQVTGHWYGYVTPDDAPILLDQHILKNEIVDRLWRGQMGLTKEEQQEAQQERHRPNGEAFLEKGDNGVGLEKGEKESGLGTENSDAINGNQNDVINITGCCQGSNLINCCQSSAPEDNVRSDEMDLKATSKSVEYVKENTNATCSSNRWRGVSKWFETWEREDTFAAFAVMGAVASVAVAYSFYRKSG